MASPKRTFSASLRKADSVCLTITSGARVLGATSAFFQRKSEWVGLLEQHPDLFELAKGYEKFNPETGERFTWCQGESLEELSQPDRIAQIKANTEKTMASKKTAKPNRRLIEILTDVHDDEDDEEPCLICHK